MQYEKKKIIMIGDIRKSGRKDTVEEIWLLGIDDSYANDDTKKNKVLRKGIYEKLEWWTEESNHWYQWFKATNREEGGFLYLNEKIKKLV